jgi:hypothetical protein
VKRFEDTCSTNVRRTGSGRPSCSYEQVDKVLEADTKLADSHPYGMCSVRQIAADDDVNVCKTTVHKILRREGLHPYRPVQVQQLLPQDYPDRVAFAHRALAEFGDDFRQVLWTDEAIFHLTPHVSSLTGAIWSDEPPGIFVEKPLHPAAVLVWAGFTARWKLPPFFFDGTVSGDSYCHMLSTHCVPFLTAHHALSGTTFQQDGAAPHIARQVKEFLTQKFHSRVISRHFNFPWPARSPDLNPMDFFYWGYLKQKVYSHKLRNVNDLREAIAREIEEMDGSLLAKVVEFVPSRLQEVIATGGKQLRK